MQVALGVVAVVRDGDDSQGRLSPSYLWLRGRHGFGYAVLTRCNIPIIGPRNGNGFLPDRSVEPP